jgi:flagellin-like protein
MKIIGNPVIGCILMVAITVILAAVIAAFVFGMAGNQKDSIPDPYNKTVTVVIADKGFSDHEGFFFDGVDPVTHIQDRYFFIPEEGYKLSKIHVAEIYKLDIREDYYIPYGWLGKQGWRVINITRIEVQSQ